ncbi:NAD(P)H-binding protein [Roseicyclus sp. F158]|uniref:NAD(P)H-binding protein n=1 Tax=Tropicimonas omnivorans TaxID=3075590 RepID=A0ABU3DGK5_9RHOB|nr:NAD(P)H-binding protein [Roseicyclus sp. F158]MDT0682850.1 NAD(P)H-binding protein [Roseicyclus sp. F158]
MSEPGRKTILVIGANGATGRDAVQAARRRGHKVIACEPHWSQDETPQDPDIEARDLDVMSGDLAPQLEGADAVVSAIGVPLSLKTAFDPPPLYTRGVRNTITGMRKAGLSRLIVISAAFVEQRRHGPIWFQMSAMNALRRVYDQMGAMEHMLEASDDWLNWTAARPGWLMDGEVTGDYQVFPDSLPKEVVRTRHADLGDFMVRLAESGEWSRQTPAIGRREASEKSSPKELFKELAG